MKRWHNFWRGYGSNHGDSGHSEDGWYRTVERLVALPPPPPPPSPPLSQFPNEEERGKWEDISTAIGFVAGNNGDGGGGGSVEDIES